jgi:UDP-N-acetylglucosamine acyltransferase
VVRQDVPPFLTVAGNPLAPHGVNSEGLKRRGFSPEALSGLKRAYKILYKSGLSLSDAHVAIAALAEAQPELKPLADFLAVSGRGIVR